MEIEFEKQMKYPEEQNPAFHPNLEMTSSTVPKDYGNFFDFLRDVKKWQTNKESKIKEKVKQAKSKELQGLDFTPKINDNSRRMIEKREEDDVLERMQHFD